jgi:hypothetical protein
MRRAATRTRSRSHIMHLHVLLMCDFTKSHNWTTPTYSFHLKMFLLIIFLWLLRAASAAPFVETSLGTNERFSARRMSGTVDSFLARYSAVCKSGSSLCAIDSDGYATEWSHECNLSWNELLAIDSTRVRREIYDCFHRIRARRRMSLSQHLFAVPRETTALRYCPLWFIFMYVASILDRVPNLASTAPPWHETIMS